MNAVDESKSIVVSDNNTTEPAFAIDGDYETIVPCNSNVIPLTQFVADFGTGLLNAVSRQNPPIYDGCPDPRRDAVMSGLKRQAFPAQRDLVQATTRLLIDHDSPAAIMNGDMGSGKTIMAICAAAVMFAEGYKRTLVISPPHLVYKWRREILETVPNARVWILNGPDTLRKLLQLRAMLNDAPSQDQGQEFFILGRVRMRMGFHWRPVVIERQVHQRLHVEAHNEDSLTFVQTLKVAACPRCGAVQTDADGNSLTIAGFNATLGDSHAKCKCGEQLWSLMRAGEVKDRTKQIMESLCQIPTIGPKTAQRLVQRFGADMLSGMLVDNIYEFVNLMDDDGKLVFSDRHAQRIEKALGKAEFAFGHGGYQPSEFIKRYLPDGYFDLLVVDEGHEYKNESSAQGQAMGVLAAKCRKVLLLTGTLMGGYADDLFYLLWRLFPRQMIEDGYTRTRNNSLGTAALSFLRDHGVLIDIYKETQGSNHKTARGKKTSVHTKKGPGFGPKGVARYVLPFTAFLKLKQIEGNALPPYEEHFVEVDMAPDQGEHYRSLEKAMKKELQQALRHGDRTLLGVVINVLLAWPDCCFREEVVKHPRNRTLLALVPRVFGEGEPSPKEKQLIDICLTEKSKGRKVLVYSIYTGKRDTLSRLKRLLEEAGLNAAVLRSSVDSSKREDWIMEQVDRGVDIVITNPELVKTGLDLLDFPTIVFMQTGSNTYTLQQAARRSWRIGQKQSVDVYFLCYGKTAQVGCLTLMAKKIAVSQSTSGDMPDTGLDVLNQDGDSLEVALAKQLVA